MEELDDNALLDSVTFYTKAHQNRFDAIISSNGVTDKIASGTLDQLLFHLPRLSDSQSRSSSDCFKLELTNTDNDVSWFTKSTVSRFLCLISSSDWLKSATSTENEISQLEDARNFHLALYTKDHVNVQGVSADVGNPDEAGATPRVKSDASADPTKNDLLRALDLRLLALKEEISSSFDRALGFVPSTDLISDLMSFCDYCGASKMRDHLVKYLESRQIDRPLVNSGNELLGKSGRTTSESIPQAYLQDKDLNFARTNSTLAKIALAERQISSESEDSDSSEGTKTSADRSRSLIRAPSPRRSASPMRRVQIGRSGSRRPAAVAIRSLNYFPPREKLPLKDTNIDVSSSCEAEQEKPSNRTEASARRMSVQDAINLFERKKMEESLSGHIRRSSSEVPFIAAKPVLRRWSSGMCDANKQEPEVTNSVDVTDTAEEEKNIVPEDPKTEIAQCLVPSNEETEEKVSETSEWSKKKEAELNQMLVKLMETKSSKYGNNPPPSSQKRDPSKQQKEKTEISRKLGEKGTVKPRSTVEVNSQRKMRTVSKADPPAQAQKSRRNSSPPVLTKKDPPKPTLTKKASPKSALPLIRSSLPSNSYTKTAATPGKPQSTLSPSTPTLKAERTPRPLKSGKISSNEAKKVPAKSEEDRKQSSKTKIVTPARNESGVVSAKSTVPTRARLQNKAPKKSTVVPLESKLSKETTTLESKLDANLPLAEEKKTVVEAIDIVSPTPEDHDNDHDVSKLDDDVTPDKVENPDPVLVAVNETEKVNVQENSEEKVEAISSAAWVEEDQERIHSDGSSSCQVAPSDLAAVAAISSRARHSLSQMLQAENGEPEVLEWGNAENPPALVYQKDAPTGLKRLLKFARKSKGEVNLSDRSSPSLISDVDDDSEESKVNGKKSSGKPKSTFSEKTSVDFLDAQEILPAQTGQRSSASSRKLREGQTNKASRSFFSLSSFKSSKTVDPKSR